MFMKTTTTTDAPSTSLVMMTLCTLTATAPDPRPSGESLPAQQERILAGITQQLNNSQLATLGAWRAVWIGLSADRANLVYIAQGPNNQLAVCLRGTVMGSPIDMAEDMKVEKMLPFQWGGQISQGAMEAFTEVTSAVCLCALPPLFYPPPLPPLPLSLVGLNLTQALVMLLAFAPPPTIYITGHSLGGALATTVGLYLSKTLPGATLQLYTFAAPTAGDNDFATAVNSAFSLSSETPNGGCFYNQYDLIPRAWADLKVGVTFFPQVHWEDGSSRGPIANAVVLTLVNDFLATLPGTNTYVQPVQKPALNLDPNYGQFVWTSSNDSTAAFLQEVGYQHSNNTYLALLGAKGAQVPADLVPTVTGVSSTVDSSTGTLTATITGTGFTSGSVVDFGTLPAASVVVNSSTQITATVSSYVGTVDVRVTNIYGTSPATSADFCPPVA
jgi:hypothetical protein